MMLYDKDNSNKNMQTREINDEAFKSTLCQNRYVFKFSNATVFRIKFGRIDHVCWN